MRIPAGYFIFNRSTKVAKILNKEELFENFLNTTIETFKIIDTTFNVEIFKDFFGVAEEETHSNSGRGIAFQHCRSSPAWTELNNLYDFAVEGILKGSSDGDPMERAAELVIGAAEMLSLITTENNGPCAEWDHVVALGDGRYGLDTGEDIEARKLALLAGIDQRTVRNAISANELDASKESGTVFISNKSAVRWLSSRRGYTPTRHISIEGRALASISSATELGAYLSTRRDSLNIALEDGKYPEIRLETIVEFEAGQFNFSLDDTYPLADFYQIDRGELLEAVMRSFYPNQFKALVERNC
jgi:hypothetical protein